MGNLDLKRVASLPPALQLKILSMSAKPSDRENGIKPGGHDSCENCISTSKVLHDLGTCGYTVIDGFLREDFQSKVLQQVKVHRMSCYPPEDRTITDP